MTKGFRDIDLPIDDSTLVDLEGLTKDDIIRTLRIALPPMVATRVINRLHNKRHQKQAKTIKAFQLTGQGFEPMAEIDIDVNEFSAHGQITNAVDIGNADSIAVTILGKNHRETTYLVGREDPVRIWKKDNIYGRIVPPTPDYDKVVTEGYFRVSYIAEHLDSFFGKRMAVKNKGTGILREVEVHANDKGAFFITLGDTYFRVDKDDTILVYKEVEPGFLRPGPYPWGAPRPGIPRVPTPRRRPTAPRPSTLGPSMARFVDAMVTPNDRPDYTTHAYAVATNDYVEFRGMTVSLRDGSVKGKLTDFHLDSEGKVVLVIDGQLHKCNYGEAVRLWKKEK